MARDSLRPLEEIRFGETEALIGERPGIPTYAGRIFNVPQVTGPLVQRIGAICRERGISIGRATHLWLCLTPALEEARVLPHEWPTALQRHMPRPFRWVMYGLNLGFNRLSQQEQQSALTRAAFDCLRALACAGSERLTEAERVLEAQGDEAEVPFRRKATKRLRIVASYTIPDRHIPATVWLTVTDVPTSRTRRLRLAELSTWHVAPDLVGQIVVVDGRIVIRPRSSLRSKLALEFAGLAGRVPMTIEMELLFGQ